MAVGSALFEFNARSGSSEIGCMILRRLPGRLRQIRKVGRLFTARFFVTFCHRPPLERIIFEPTGLSACIGSVVDAANDRNPTRSVRRVRDAPFTASGDSVASELCEGTTSDVFPAYRRQRCPSRGRTVLRRYLFTSPSNWKDECDEGTRSAV